MPTNVNLTYKDRKWSYSAKVGESTIEGKTSFDSLDTALKDASENTDIPQPILGLASEAQYDQNLEDAKQGDAPAPPSVPLSNDAPAPSAKAANAAANGTASSTNN